ncbi:MAG: DUF4331 domain-containing protein [Planctomycetes bacterium]|nr:DUF4331 domain-containing protein [Planctomycetota bacterium]
MKRIPLLGALASALALVLAHTSPVDASSHREAPAITEDPCVDCTDVYSFVSPDAPSKVTLIANYIPFEEPSGGPNYFKFSDTALYEIHIDNDGDAIEDITFQWKFTTTTKSSATFLYNTGAITYSAGGDTYTNLNVEQRYTLTRIDGPRRTGTETVLGTNILVAPNNVGTKSIPGGYAPLAAAAVKALPSGITCFAGPRDDPFYLNLGRAFDLVNIDPVIPGGTDALGAPLPSGPTKDDLAGFNCHTLALQIPITALTPGSTGTTAGATPTGATDPNAIIGVWSTASRRQVILNRLNGKDQYTGGAWVQVSRLGMPLVNEVVIPRADKDKWNNSEPKDDAQFLTYVQNPELAGILVSLFGITVPANPRADLVTVFLTGITGVNAKGVPCEYQRLNMLIAPTVGALNRMGVLPGDSLAAQLDGYPNGRRLGDDTIDISLRAVAGGYAFTAPTDIFPNNKLGDTVISNDLPFGATFPYLASPHDGVSRQHDNE